MRFFLVVFIIAQIPKWLKHNGKINLYILLFYSNILNICQFFWEPIQRLS